jgi:hypothetical protein
MGRWTASAGQNGQNERNQAEALSFAQNAQFAQASPATDPAEDWTPDHEERAAIVEFDGGAPAAWAEGLARLNLAQPPGDVPPHRWVRFIDDAGQFLDGGWAARAAALGWGPLELFGCDRHAPFARIDQAGLLWLLNGRPLAMLSGDVAIIACGQNTVQTYRRGAAGHGAILVWELL